MPEVANPANDITFFKYGATETSFQNITAFVNSVNIYDDSSLPSIFGPLTPIEANSKVGNPLFIDPNSLNFNLQL
jgi:hypothetical protein